jgi:tetratricopeptide (TPR) repeat protein
LRNKKDLPEAAAALQRATELLPGSADAPHNLGQVLQQQGRYAEAEQAYLRAIKRPPDYVPAYDSLARLLATYPDDRARDGKRAAEYATTACERTGWKDPLCLDTLAAAYAEAGQFEAAVRSRPAPWRTRHSRAISGRPPGSGWNCTGRRSRFAIKDPDLLSCSH